MSKELKASTIASQRWKSDNYAHIYIQNNKEKIQFWQY